VSFGKCSDRHCPILEPGTHEVVVSLNANNHAAYTVDGEKAEANVTIEVA
jgi:hypothetical protein